MSLKDAFFTEQKKPIKTVQKLINKRPQVSHKFAKIKKAYKAIKGKKTLA